MTAFDIVSHHPPSQQQTPRLALQARALSETRYRLRAPDGSYVHGCDLALTTTVVAWAWIGFQRNLEAVRRLHPELSRFATVAIPPERGVALLPAMRGGDPVSRLDP